VESPTEDRAAPAPAPAPVPAAPVEPRQRWRLTFGRTAAADGEVLAGRDYTALWDKALVESGLPLATTDAGRCRFALGAPLPARTAGRAELADLWLTERVATWRVREGLDRVLPPGHELVDLESIWLGAPALAGRVAAADYVVRLGGGIDRTAIVAAVERLMAADRIVRERAKGGGVKSYDLRALLISIEIGDAADAEGGGHTVVRLRSRIHPELGSGRPDEVIAALADELDKPLEPVATIRERLVLVDEITR
jgi:radical SAM-linked protein